MKNIIILCTFLLIATVGLSQNRSVQFKPTEYFNEYSGAASDTISNNDSLFSIEYQLNKAEPVKYNVAVKLTKVSGTPRVVAKLQGKVFSADTYSDITTVTWYGTSSDTTIKYTQNSTAQYYRYFKLYFDANTTAQKSKVTTATVKLWDK